MKHTTITIYCPSCDEEYRAFEGPMDEDGCLGVEHEGGKSPLIECICSGSGCEECVEPCEACGDALCRECRKASDGATYCARCLADERGLVGTVETCYRLDELTAAGWSRDEHRFRSVAQAKRYARKACAGILCRVVRERVTVNDMEGVLCNAA